MRGAFESQQTRGNRATGASANKAASSDMGVARRAPCKPWLMTWTIKQGT